MKFFILALFLSVTSALAADSQTGGFDTYANCFMSLQKFSGAADHNVGAAQAQVSLHRSGMQVVVPGSHAPAGGGAPVPGIYIYTLQQSGVTAGAGLPGATFIPFPTKGQKGFQAATQSAGGVMGLLGKTKDSGDVEYFLSSGQVVGTKLAPEGSSAAMGLESELHLYFSGKTNPDGSVSLTSSDIYTYPKFTHFRKTALLGGAVKVPGGGTDDDFERAHFAKSPGELTGLQDDATRAALVTELKIRADYLQEHYQKFGGPVTAEKLANFKKANDVHPGRDTECNYSWAAERATPPQFLGDCAKLAVIGDPLPPNAFDSAIKDCKPLIKDSSLSKEDRLALAKSFANVEKLTNQHVAVAGTDSSTNGSSDTEVTTTGSQQPGDKPDNAIAR